MHLHPDSRKNMILLWVGQLFGPDMSIDRACRPLDGSRLRRVYQNLSPLDDYHNLYILRIHNTDQLAQIVFAFQEAMFWLPHECCRDLSLVFQILLMRLFCLPATPSEPFSSYQPQPELSSATSSASTISLSFEKSTRGFSISPHGEFCLRLVQCYRRRR